MPMYRIRQILTVVVRNALAPSFPFKTIPKELKNTLSLRNVDKDQFEVDMMITSDENINLTYTILEDMYEPNRTELPPKTFVQFRLSPFEYSAMQKIARFLNSKRLNP